MKVNRIPLRFGLDTGAGIEISMWNEVSDMLALKVARPDTSTPLAAGEIRAGISEPLSLEFMGTTHPGSRIAIIDAPSFAKWQVQGLVGWPSIRNNIWLIDLSRGRVEPLAQLPDLSGWLKYPVVPGATTLQILVPATAGSKPGIISMDTGSPDGVAVAPALWDSWRAAHPNEPVTYGGAFMLATGYSRLQVTAAKEWSIDDLVLKEVLLAQANPTDLAAFGPDYLATFGLRALRNFSVIIDGKAGFAYFRPTSNPAPLGDYNRLGAIFCPTDASAARWTATVLPDTPAAKAGLRDGDVLVGINHLEIAHWRQRPETWPPRVALQPAGTPVEIEYTRGGRRMVAQAVLQDILRPGAAPVPAQPFPPEVPDFHFLPPLASVIRKADALKLPLRDPALSTDGTLHKDDKVTALVTVVDDHRLRQWLVLFVNTELKPSEQKLGKPYHVFTSSGNDLVF